jgi:hypothetical protein
VKDHIDKYISSYDKREHKDVIIMKEHETLQEFKRRVRDAVAVTSSENGAMYRTLFVGKNFYVYRLVNNSDQNRYRGNNYTEEGYVLAWADVQEMNEFVGVAPHFVLRRDD